MVFQRVSPALTKKSVIFTFLNVSYQELVTWYIVGIPTKTNFEHFISLLLIIGGLFRAMAQMKACNFLDPHQNTYWILNQIFGVKSATNLT